MASITYAGDIGNGPMYYHLRASEGQSVGILNAEKVWFLSPTVSVTNPEARLLCTIASITIPRGMYNIDSATNGIVLDGVQQLVAEGEYSATQLAAAITANAAFTAAGVTATWDPVSRKMQFFNAAGIPHTVDLASALSTMAVRLGDFLTHVIPPAGSFLTTDPVNLTSLNDVVYVRSSTLVSKSAQSFAGTTRTSDIMAVLCFDDAAWGVYKTFHPDGQAQVLPVQALDRFGLALTRPDGTLLDLRGYDEWYATLRFDEVSIRGSEVQVATQYTR